MVCSFLQPLDSYLKIKSTSQLSACCRKAPQHGISHIFTHKILSPWDRWIAAGNATGMLGTMSHMQLSPQTQSSLALSSDRAPVGKAEALREARAIGVSITLFCTASFSSLKSARPFFYCHLCSELPSQPSKEPLPRLD